MLYSFQTCEIHPACIAVPTSHDGTGLIGGHEDPLTRMWDPWKLKLQTESFLVCIESGWNQESRLTHLSTPNFSPSPNHTSFKLAHWWRFICSLIIYTISMDAQSRFFLAKSDKVRVFIIALKWCISHWDCAEWCNYCVTRGWCFYGRWTACLRCMFDSDTHAWIAWCQTTWHEMKGFWSSYPQNIEFQQPARVVVTHSCFLDSHVFIIWHSRNVQPSSHRSLSWTRVAL